MMDNASWSKRCVKGASSLFEMAALAGRTGGVMKALRLFTMLTLTFVIMAATTVAQPPEKIMVDVPFEFTVANKTLPAGNYTIKSLSPSRLLIRSQNGHEAV